MWQTEKEFGQTIMAKLKRLGYSCMRIESASTITGCPDLWVQGNGHDFFIELKNNKNVGLPARCDMHCASPLKVPWRQGQQAWATQYAASHTHVVSDSAIFKKYSWTFMGLHDGAVAIRMHHVFENSYVDFDDADMFILNDVNSLHDMLLANSYDTVTKLYHTREETYYEYAKAIAMIHRPSDWFEVDIPAGSDMLGWTKRAVRECVYRLCKEKSNE